MPLASRIALNDGWELCSSAPGSYRDPGEAASGPSRWIAATCPSTAAAALRAAGRWSLDDAPVNFDDSDWWFRLRFVPPADAAGDAYTLGFDGLATLAEVWLDDRPILRSDNMFVAHEVELDSLAPGPHDLYLCFRSLEAALKARRPRPRWRAPMIHHQQLRWVRTTLLGRTPGWSPPAAAVGPWRPVWIRPASLATLLQPHVVASYSNGTGRVTVAGLLAPAIAGAARLRLQLSLHGTVLWESQPATHGHEFSVELTADQPQPWWPHTHGKPTLYDLTLSVTPTDRPPFDLSLGRVGFREATVQQDAEGGFRIAVNGSPVFCRGACWTPLDVVSLHTDPDTCRAALQQVADAGMNMLRLSGTMVPESEEFYRLCDELGILVWQDYQFANMDYPADNDAFSASVELEVTQLSRRLACHPSVVMLCGNSEVEQQAAMWGASRELWQPALFHVQIPRIAAAIAPQIPYWPSSAHGGDFPHQNDVGTTSYYGYGAYLRGPDDVRRSAVRFATECLAFANVPERATLALLPGGTATRVQHAAWKARSPRDLGAGWDFDDVRDHYLNQMWGIDVPKLRYSDHDRYLALGRRVTGEAMVLAYTDWRRRQSVCGGALIWFLRDLWAGAGWGVIDSAGLPKATYYYLRRVLQPVWVGITDEGTNGLAIHVGNETAAELSVTLILRLFRDGRHQITRVERTITLRPRATEHLTAGSLLGEFHDLSYAYRFGPLSCNLVTVDLESADYRSQAYYLPDPQRHVSPTLVSEMTATARRSGDGGYELLVRTEAFAYSVHVDVDGYLCDDQYFSLMPGSERRLMLRPTQPNPPALFGYVAAINSLAPARIEIQS